MNGIAPFFSLRTLLAFVIAPISFGLFIMLPVGLFLGDATIGLVAIAISGFIGYPVAILAGIPTYLVFRRLNRVTFEHFLVFGLVVGLVLGFVPEFDFVPRRFGWLLFHDNLPPVQDRNALKESLPAAMFMVYLTILSCSVFWLIVRERR